MSAEHHHHHPGHGHHHHGPTSERALLVAMGLNGGFLVVEALAGWLTDSLALLSDAGHMVSDVGALLVAYLALRIRHRQPSGYTFGLRRAPVLGALINAIVLIVIVVLIAVEAVERFASPPELHGTAILITAAAGLFINLASAWYLAKSQDDSVNIRGAMLHLLADALGSVAALVGACAILFFGFRLADPIASVVIATLILVGSLPLLRDTSAILLQRAPANVDLARVESALISEEKVRGISDLHVWQIDSGEPVLSALIHADVDDLSEANRLADCLRRRLQDEFQIDHATLECRHVDSDDCTPHF